MKDNMQRDFTDCLCRLRWHDEKHITGTNMRKMPDMICIEGMSMGVDFIYSADGKFILVPMDCGTDITIAFCE